MITFTFDDGYVSTLRQAAPILREFGMSGTVGAICNRVLWTNTPRYMGVDELRQLADAGWEVASHSLFHRRLPQLPPSYDDEAADWRYDPDSDAFVADCRWEDVGTVVYEKEYLERAPSLERLHEMPSGFVLQPKFARIYARTGDGPKVGGELRLGSAEREIAESRRVLEENGFDIRSFIVPYSMWPDHLHQFGARYYPIVATVRGGPNVARSVTRATLSRFSVNKDRPISEIIKRIKAHSQRQSWSIICFHDIVEEINRNYDWRISEFRQLVEWVAASKNSCPYAAIRRRAPCGQIVTGAA